MRDQVIAYLTNDRVLKDPFPFVTEAYGDHYNDLRGEPDFLNVTSVYQNQFDSFKFLVAYDSSHGTDHAGSYAHLYLRSRFLRFGGLDLWESKRMHLLILQWAISKGNAAVAWQYLRSFSTSPSRVALLADLDLNPFAGDDITVIGVSEPNVRTRPSHLIRLAANHSGMNYIVNMKLEERDKLHAGALSVYIKHFDECLKNQVGFSDSRELILILPPHSRTRSIRNLAPILAEPGTLARLDAV